MDALLTVVLMQRNWDGKWVSSSIPFINTTFFEAIDLTRALGLHYIEATIGHGFARKVHKTSMPDSPLNGGNGIKRKLAESGVKCESIYYWMDGSGKGFEDIVKFAKIWDG